MKNTIEKMMKTGVASEGYYFDITTKTLYMSSAWEKKSNTVGSDACNVRDQIEAMFPNVMTKTIARKHKNVAVTYSMMRAYISVMPDADKNLAEMDRQIAISKAFKSSYKHVAEWFGQQFPHYGELVVEGKDGEAGWNAVELFKEARAQEAKKAAATARKDEDNVLPIAG